MDGEESMKISDFEIICKQESPVSPQPMLKIANNGDIDVLKQNLCEVLQEDNIESTNKIDLAEKTTDEDSKTEDEKSDINEDEENEMKLSSCLEDGTVFNGVAYLGAATVNAPKSEMEIHRNMAVLNREQALDQCIQVNVKIPSCSAGCVVLQDAGTMQEIASYEVHRILFYAHGTSGSEESACFAFTWSHGNSQESAIFQCHVFRCNIPEAVNQVSACFAKAFMRSPPRSLPANLTGITTAGDGDNGLLSPVTAHIEVFTFEVNMEIKEIDSKGSYSSVPKDRSQFKLRANTEKQLCLSVQQVSSEHQRVLQIERCFGVLVSPGKNVRHADMQLLEMVSMGSGSTDNTYLITAQLDPFDPAFSALNIVDDTSGVNRKYITIAIDLVVKGIQEPVRFIIETSVRIYPKTERFWNNFYRRSLIQQFYLNVKELQDISSGEAVFEVLSVDTSEEIDRSRGVSLSLASVLSPSSISSFDAFQSPKEDNTSDDEPLLSGTGEVSKDCSETQLECWGDVLTKWTQSGSRPKQLAPLVRQGIPEPLRGEVWQRLTGCTEDHTARDNYRILIAEECSCEPVIQRDINRTFPAHEFFKKDGGSGQDSLFRLSKAYAVHDEEVGYCQGLSFLAAALLLHMPEEEAFCVLVKLMYDYKLRNLFKDGFEHLYMRLYQLNRLMEEQLPDLWQHFSEKGVEPHMFASQWFLTIFTAKFPLYFVFRILDLFMLQGIDTLFQVAMALLQMSKKDLLSFDFEGILKYFRVSLPKRCRGHEVTQELIKVACGVKVKRLRKYEQDFYTIKAAQDKEEQRSNEMERLRSELQRSEDDRKRLEEELVQVKEIVQREVQRAAMESIRNAAIIADYKQICSQLSRRLDENVNAEKDAELKRRCAVCSADLQQADGWIDPLTASQHSDPLLLATQQRVRELELELAQTKLAHVEAECRNQDLSHQLTTASTELQSTNRGSWFYKTLVSLKEVAKKDGSNSLPLESPSKEDTPSISTAC